MSPHRSFLPLLLQWELGARGSNSTTEDELLKLFEAKPVSATAAALPPSQLDEVKSSAKLLLETESTRVRCERTVCLI